MVDDMVRPASPRRAVEVEIFIGADHVDEVPAAVREMLAEFEAGGVRALISAGYSRSYAVTVALCDTDHAQYAAALKAYVEANRLEAAGEKGEG